jgi:hypothetical protein
MAEQHCGTVNVCHSTFRRGFGGRVVRAHGMLPALGAMFLLVTSYSGYLFAIALHLQTALHRDPTPRVLFFVAQIPMGLESGVAYSPRVTWALSGVAPADASGLVTTSVQLAQVVGFAVIGSFYLALAATEGFDHAAPVTRAVDAAMTGAPAISPAFLPRVC